MGKVVNVSLRPSARKKHSVVFVGAGPEGESVSFYVSNGILRRLEVPLGIELEAEELPGLQVTFEVES